MEDSYTVHRRRKAAARRREKTPEPSSRLGIAADVPDDEEVDAANLVSEEPTVAAAAAAACAVGATAGLMDVDEDEGRRARMERMVEDTERMELDDEQPQRAKSKPRQEEEQPPAKSRAKSPAVSRPEKSETAPSREAEPRTREVEPRTREAEPRTREAEPRTREAPVTKKAEPPAKREQPPPEEEAPQPPVKVSRKPRGEPAASEGTELRRRLGSPETAKTRSARHLSPATAPNDEELSDHRSRKRVSSRHRYQNPSDEDEPAPPPPSSQHHRSRRSPSQPLKKQIIPLSDDSLMDDIPRAKRAYSHRDREPSDEYEYEDEEDEEEEEIIHPRRKRETTVRKRKTSVMHTDEEKEEISKSMNQGGGWFSWIPFFGSRKQKVDEMIEENDKKKEKERPPPEEEKPKAKLEKTPSSEEEETSDKATIGEFFRSIVHFGAEFNEFCRQNPEEVQILVELRNLCIVETIISIIICGLGGLAFRFTEGAFESFYKCGVKRVKRDFLDSLWNYSHNMKEDDWKSMARRKLMEFEEQLHAAHEAGVQTYSGQKSWTFINAMAYCLTIISTIGYGHISPSTTTGRALTIIYAIFGIPMFLIVLADFGKLFTRGIKFLWAFVRRLYYTGSCRKVRRTVPMQEMMKGVQMVYDLATFRRPSQMSPEELQEMQRQHQQTVLSLDGNAPQPQQQPESPSTPAMSTFEIDDEFNLPISVAITILVLYIFIGATVFNIVEDWSFFESFYFVFISMSTIGFGDFVPKEPLYMMLSMVYLIFGLALTSMCINVVQVMLADQFKQASQKIGASIGFHVSDEDGSLKPAQAELAEAADEQSPASEVSKPIEKIAPKAKQEDDEI